jgi:hypothetical protein
MQALGVYFECFPNKDFREAHLSIPVVPEPYDKYSEGGDPERVKLLQYLLDRRIEIVVDSVIGNVKRKSITFERNLAFSWDDTISAVVDVLGKFYNRPVEFAVMERDPEWDKPRPEHDDMY